MKLDTSHMGEMWIVHFFDKLQVIWSVNHKFSGEKSYKKTTSKHKKYIIIDQIGTTCVNLFSFIFTTLFWKISFLNWLNCVFGMSHRTILYDRPFFRYENDPNSHHSPLLTEYIGLISQSIRRSKKNLAFVWIFFWHIDGNK